MPSKDSFRGEDSPRQKDRYDTKERDRYDTKQRDRYDTKERHNSDSRERHHHHSRERYRVSRHSIEGRDHEDDGKRERQPKERNAYCSSSNSSGDKYTISKEGPKDVSASYHFGYKRCDRDFSDNFSSKSSVKLGQTSRPLKDHFLSSEHHNLAKIQKLEVAEDVEEVEDLGSIDPDMEIMRSMGFGSFSSTKVGDLYLKIRASMFWEPMFLQSPLVPR